MSDPWHAAGGERERKRKRVREGYAARCLARMNGPA